ncbi:flavoprotein [Brevibacterium sp. UCMA 11754]|uniref:flavoprotein n=1 Tax=Brevibacterium sp. UCMA 11754 TaxID=2749198 RepID=UPI001F1FCC84|nr:flavoprotein [Brevibacterium sp. UCMA 11754]MCF2573965.1 flavoprotein [Brevibacterium sp. UCMA 11754]
MTDITTGELPVAVIGAGPVGLAAAAHVIARDMEPLVLEAGATPAAAVSVWGHIGLFSPWKYNIDQAARALLGPTGWVEPNGDHLPTGAELVTEYLAPLAATPQLSNAIRTQTRVIAISRVGKDRTRTPGRGDTPFLVRTQNGRGEILDHVVRAVIDTSGTWETPNPLGQAGLSALGEDEAREAGLVSSPLPDVLGRDRAQFAGRHTLVVGAGHSAANTLLALGELREAEPTTRISWAIRGTDPAGVYGGGDQDGLPARGTLGTRLRNLVEAGRIEVHTSVTITRLGITDPSATSATSVGHDDTASGTASELIVTGTTPDGSVSLDVDRVVPATGFRPDLSFLREIRLDLDPIVEAPTGLGPLIDPEYHSCGTVAPHGARLLAHPEKDFYIAGMKSYGRAPTFLMATGYEQVRSIVAAIAGDQEAADKVELVLPETGVCSADIGSSCESTSAEVGVEAAESDSCCDSPAQPVTLGIPSGLEHGRSTTVATD